MTLLLASTAAADDLALTSGPALGIGLGHSSGGLGGHAYYYLQLPNERWRLAAHAGVGVLGYVVANGKAEGHVGGAGGVLAAFGHHHRLVLDLLAAPFQTSTNRGERLRVDYGIGAQVGYEWMARYGLAVRTSLGVAYCPKANGVTIGPAFDIVSVDYKFW